MSQYDWLRVPSSVNFMIYTCTNDVYPSPAMIATWKNSQMWKYIKVYTGDILYGLECTTCSTHWDIQFIIFACCRDVRYAWNENDGFTLTRPPPRSKLFLIKNVIYNFKFWKAIHFLHQKGIRIQMPLGNPSLDVKQLGNPVNMHPTEYVIAH